MHRIFTTSVASVYPHYVAKAERKGRTREEVDEVIKLALETDDRPVVIDFIVHRDAMVWPMVPAGVSNDKIQAARHAAPVWERED